MPTSAVSRLKSARFRRRADYTQKTDSLREGCAARAAIDVVRGRWKPSILFHLKDGTRRFTELQAEMKGITAQALTVQLRQLEADDVIGRTVYAEIPVRVEYALTESGESLWAVMAQFEVWGAKYLRRQAAKRARLVKNGL